MSEIHDDLPEPERDPLLRLRLADAFGETPRNVDLAALAGRTRSAALFRLRARSRARTRRAAWWEMAGQWSCRALPIGALAAAAALALAALTPATESAAVEENDTVSAAVVSSATPAQAARQVASGTIGEGSLWSAAVGSAEEPQ